VTDEPHSAGDAGLVLSGGGARAAYQVGVLRAIAKVLGKGHPPPFPIITGTSAGAINAAVLGIHADSFRRGVARLVRFWRRIDAAQVYHTDVASLSRHALRWLIALLGVGRVPARAASLLENDPLVHLLRREIHFDRLRQAFETGDMRALAVNATSYTTGHAVTFFDGAPDLTGWQRTRRRGERCKLAVEHLVASTAIPFVFPPTRIGDDYYMDGSVRQIAPLSPALHLGARRLVIIPVGQFAGQRPPPGHHPPHYPSFAQTAGHALSSIFLDNLGADLERLMQMNRLSALVPPSDLARNGIALNHIGALVIAPSRDLAALAQQYTDRLAPGVRTLLRGFGPTHGTGANLMSYLLFDRDFCGALIKLGYADAMARRDEIDTFVGSTRLAYEPLPLRDFF
jgi:NTE family protein